MQLKQHRVMVVDDEAHIARVIEKAIMSEEVEIFTYRDGTEALAELAAKRPHVIITDMRMPTVGGLEILRRAKEFDPEVNVILITAYGSLETALEAMRGGAFDYLVKPFRIDELRNTLKRAFGAKRIVLGRSAPDQAFMKRYQLRSLIGSSESMQKVYSRIERVAQTESTVLILGESGTGKELVARSIHYNSSRKEAPFVSVNCAALPAELLESELFGHEKGSFTGAIASKAGLMELAHGGTFFLDEVGDMSLPLQAKLLRVLQEREIMRVGGLETIKVDVRIVAATSRDPSAEVRAGRFREDLFYRLNVIPINLPPLRERREDIHQLAFYFLGFCSEKMRLKSGIQIAEDAMEVLENYGWPGNVRELENVIERILALLEGTVVTRAAVEEALKDLLPAAQAPPHEHAHTQPATEVKEEVEVIDLRAATEDFERSLIEKALDESRGNKYQAAKMLHLSRQSLQYKLRKYGLG